MGINYIATVEITGNVSLPNIFSVKYLILIHSTIISINWKLSKVKNWILFSFSVTQFTIWSPATEFTIPLNPTWPLHPSIGLQLWLFLSFLYSWEALTLRWLQWLFWSFVIVITIHCHSIADGQSLPPRPLSESQNRLLGGIDQHWIDDESDEDSSKGNFFSRCLSHF